MPNYRDKISNSGGINKDISVEVLPPGDYPDALDISFLSAEVDGSKSITPKLGNEYVFDTGSVSAQNKKYRLYIDLVNSGTLSYQITFYKTDTTTVLFTASFTNGSLTAADTAITNAAAAAGFAINVTNNGVFLLIEFAPMSGGVPSNYYEYFINDTGTDELDDLYVFQEAIDLTLVGALHDIGSYDLLGDLFIWSTSQTNLPSDLGIVITNITHSNVLTNITITFTSAHGLNTGERILVQGVEGITSANGVWIAIASSTTQIQLALSETATIGTWVSGTGTITINPFGIGEIGVAQKVQTTQNWTYRRLLRSKEWNWNTKKQFDTYAEETATNKNIYGTNDYTPPMVFYYQTAYSQDGALSFNGGLYEYGTIFDETRLFLSVLNTRIEFTNQLQGGGALTAGNKRYAVRALTETATATDWSDVTNPVNVYVASTILNPEKIAGDIGGAVTSKVNVLTISNIQADIFKYIEVACIEYAGLAVSGYVVNRYTITSSSMTIQHTGNESQTQLDINELQVFSIPIVTAKNIRAIDNRMILSNITTASDEDLSFVAQQVRHSIIRTTIESVYFDSVDGVNYGEYQDPDNVNDNVGYMINDSYCFSLKFRYKNGGAWTKNYWVDVIKIDNSAINSANPFNDNRRNSGLPNLDITSGVTTYVPYVEFTNIDFNYITESGQRLGDIFDAISFERAECIPEILFTGVSGVSATSIVVSPPTLVSSRPPLHLVDTFVTGGAVNLEDFNNMSVGVIVLNPYRKISVIYSPDISLNSTGLNFSSGDKIINFGNPPASFLLSFANFPNQGFVEFQGNNLGAPSVIDVNDSKIISTQQSTINSIPFSNDGFTPVVQGSIGALVSTITDLNTVNNFDYGYYYVQYYRPQLNKYNIAQGGISQTEYISCGNLYLTNSQTTSSTFQVLGGDTFTQKTFLQIFCNIQTSTIGESGTGVGFFSQNRCNSQMRQKSGTTTAEIFPADTSGATPEDRVVNWLTSSIVPELLAYDKGYNIINGVDYHVAYDPDLIPNDDQPTRIRWSPVKPQNAIADLYRVFLPFDFHDLDNSFGEIAHHASWNGELITWQPGKVQRQYFNTRGTLDVRGISDVLIGDGSVMSRDGQTINNFGCQNKWSIIQGKSQGGNDTYYWIDGINKQALRLGADGSVGISTIKGLQSFLATNLTWITANDTPADGEGIHGYWHQRYHEAVWVIRAKRGVAGNLTSSDPVTIPQEWRSTTNFSNGSVVNYEGITPTDFNQVGTFYRSLQSNNQNHLPTDTTWWELIPVTDKDYYNFYSIVFNEIKDRFTCRYTPLPRIALQWQDSYLLPRPVPTYSRHYEANRGQYLVWFTEGSSSLTSDGFIEMVYNKDDSMPKMFYAYLVDSSINPYRVDFITARHETFAVTTDFENLIDKYATAIKNDILTSTTGTSPDQDTTKPWGSYIICRFYFQSGQFSKLDGAVIKFNSLNRNYTG